jgi:CRISPR-associated protein Csh1
MFQRLYELSFALPQNLATWEKLNEGMPPEYTHGFGICFDEQSTFVSIQTIQKTGKEVIYRSGPSNGTDLTPCCKLSISTSERILRAAEALKNNFNGEEKDRLWLETTIENYKQNQIVIWEELDKVKTAANLDPKTSRGFVFWAKLSNHHIEPIYTWNAAKQLLEQQFLESLSKKGGKRSKAVCLISGKKNQDVFGGFSDIACYNLDKEGSIAGGFDDKLGHRNFPISKEAAIEITRAFHYSQQHLQGSMAGQTYLILPYAINPDIREQIYEHLKEYPDRFKLGTVRDLVKKEWRLVNDFKELKDQIAFFLIFYEENNASWRIQAEVQELLPSRLKKLKESREEIENSQDLTYYNKDKEEKKVEISALTFKNFTGGSKEQSANTLKTWLVALFEGKTIDHAYFLHNLVDKLIAIGKKNPEYLHNTTLQAIGLYRYALLTHLISNDSTQEQTMSLPHFSSVYGKYIQEHADFFTKPELKTAFLTGCYVSIVSNIQHQKRGASPFNKKFIGRLLTKELLRKLYQEGHDKLMQYDSLGVVVKALDPDLTESWIACGQTWRPSNEETTFAFTMGYSLQFRISQLYKEQETSEEL